MYRTRVEWTDELGSASVDDMFFESVDSFAKYVQDVFDAQGDNPVSITIYK